LRGAAGGVGKGSRFGDEEDTMKSSSSELSSESGRSGRRGTAAVTSVAAEEAVEVEVDGVEEDEDDDGLRRGERRIGGDDAAACVVDVDIGAAKQGMKREGKVKMKNDVEEIKLFEL